MGNVGFYKEEDGLVDCFFRNEAPFCLKNNLKVWNKKTILIYFYNNYKYVFVLIKELVGMDAETSRSLYKS